MDRRDDLEARGGTMPGDDADLRNDVARLRQDCADLRARLAHGFIEIRGRLDAAAASQQQIVGLLTTLIAQRQSRPGDQ